MAADRGGLDKGLQVPTGSEKGSGPPLGDSAPATSARGLHQETVAGLHRERALSRQPLGGRTLSSQPVLAASSRSSSRQPGGPVATTLADERHHGRFQEFDRALDPFTSGEPPYSARPPPEGVAGDPEWIVVLQCFDGGVERVGHARVDTRLTGSARTASLPPPTVS